MICTYLVSAHIDSHTRLELLVNGRFHRLIDPAENVYCAWRTMNEGGRGDNLLSEISSILHW